MPHPTPVQLENLLLADKDDLASVKIADFGLAKATFGAPDGESPFAMEVLCGTLAYVAPEVLSRRPYGPAVDLWSCGVCLYILLAGVVPFSDPDEQRLVHRIATAKYSLSGPEWSAISSEAKALVKGLMCLSPAARLTASAALQHPWLRQAPEQADGRVQGQQQQPLRLNSKKLAAYAARAKPPVRHFAAGDFLIRRGQRATEVFLIREGTVEVVVDDDAGAATSYTMLNTRGAGEIVGEQGVITNAAGDLTLSTAARSSITSSVASASAPSGAETASPPPNGNGAPASPGGLPPRPPGAAADRDAAALAAVQRWNSPLSTIKMAKKWVGQRRTASVRAVTAVVAVALRRNDMEWALADEEQRDNDMREELHTALQRSQSQRSSTST
jgi:calcium/calmodulin-dependent protein kinase I